MPCAVLLSSPGERVPRLLGRHPPPSSGFTCRMSKQLSFARVRNRSSILACGRGEWLELLHAFDIPALGVDTNSLPDRGGFSQQDTTSDWPTRYKP